MDTDKCLTGTDMVYIWGEIDAILQQVHIRALNKFEVIRSQWNMLAYSSC